MSNPLPEPYASRAWLLDGPICSLSGVLQWTGEHLEFIGFGSAMHTEKGLGKLLESYGQPAAGAKGLINEEPTTVFSAAPNEFSGYKFPWYSFKKGVNLQLFNGTVKFSLIQPQNTKLPPRLVGVGISELVAAKSIAHIPAEKADSKTWEAIFQALSE
ncbi:MAG TPA: hypothetical protein DCX06_07770 [Opitutae bacterium]|nr:hypothetical protein [Opitutae bacterium]